jgi:lipoprotein-anchoring transpeptidase ErfK/SrfK
MRRVQGSQASSLAVERFDDPMPKGVAYNPPFVYNPEPFRDVDVSEEKQSLPQGPNGPFGVVWISLSKAHYGIHGTLDPALAGKTQSHGCVRLTNWDAARLAPMVSGRTEAVSARSGARSQVLLIHDTW